MANIIEIKNIENEKGHMGIVDSPDSLPFQIKRVLFIKNPAGKRGGHAHKKTKQVLICLKGSCEVFVTDGKEEKTYLLNDYKKGLFLNPKDWHTMQNFSEDVILLALGSEYYNS